MSRPGKITRHTIGSEETPAFFFLGVVSSETDYRLSVMMNRHLGSDFRKSPDDIIINTANGKHLFTRFVSSTPALSLVSNRSEGNTLIHKLKNIDFLLVTRCQYDRNKTEELANSIRGISEVTAAFIFNSNEISDKNMSLLAIL